MTDLLPLLFIALALVAGLAIGWIMRGRGMAGVEAERTALTQKLDAANERFNAAIRDLAGAEERARRADLLQDQLAQALGEREEARTALAALRSEQAARDEAHAGQLAHLQEAREAMASQFSEIGGKLLGEAQKAFLERADQRFSQAGERNEQQIKALLQPVNDSIKRYDEKIGVIEQQRTEAYGNLTGLIESMRSGQEAVRSEAAKLVNSLRAAPKARGRWGEQQLRNVLETCGLSEHADFAMEVSVESEGGRLRPDAVVRVPGGRSLVIDAKVSLNAYQDAYGAEEEGERHRNLTAHANAMRAHVDTLSRKAYWDQFDDTPDYVIMFVPGEHFLSAALEHDPTLWDFAFGKRVLLATPTNLIAIARTVAAVWRQEKLAEEAKAIGALGKDMYDRLATASGYLKRVGGGLNSAVDNYNKFVASFETRVMVTARRFKELNVETGAKDIETVDAIDSRAREHQVEALPQLEG